MSLLHPGGAGVSVSMQLNAMKAIAAEEKWLIDWNDLSFEPNLIGKGGFALVMEGQYAGVAPWLIPMRLL